MSVTRTLGARSTLAGVTALLAAGAVAAAAPPAGGVVLDLTKVPHGSYMQLAGLLPEWDEALAAGTERVTVSSADAARVIAAGFPARVIGQRPAAPATWPSCYTPLAALHTWAHALASDRSGLVSVVDVGDSLCKGLGDCRTPDGEVVPGADLLVLRVSAATEARRGRLWIDGGLHAREIPTTELMRRFVDNLVASYGIDPQITYLLQTRELFVGIASNPDGRQLVEMGADEERGGSPWYWRKNARMTAGCGWPPTSGDHAGVDLNRNHAFQWDAPGHSNRVCDETYRGSGPASEPETVAFEETVRELLGDHRGAGNDDAADRDTPGMLLNFHNATFPGTILVPWGWTTTPSPNDADLRAIAGHFARGIGYEVRQALYPVSGNTRDWGYGELGVPAYVIELEGEDFFTPCDELPRVLGGWIEPLRDALALSDGAYARIHGPEAVAIEVAATEQGPRLQALVEARPGTTVSSVEMVISRPGGEPVEGFPSLEAPQGTGIPARSLDGSFDGRSEVAAVNLWELGLEPGRYLAVMRPESDGAYGLERAAFVTVPTRTVPTELPPTPEPALLPRVYRP